MTNKERFDAGHLFQIAGRDTVFKLCHDHYGKPYLLSLWRGSWDDAYLLEGFSEKTFCIDGLGVFQFNDLSFVGGGQFVDEETKIKEIGGNYLMDEMARIECENFSTTYTDLVSGIKPGRALELIEVMYKYNLLQKQLIEKLAARLPQPEPMPVGGYKK